MEPPQFINRDEKRKIFARWMMLRNAPWRTRSEATSCEDIVVHRSRMGGPTNLRPVCSQQGGRISVAQDFDGCLLALPCVGASPVHRRLPPFSIDDPSPTHWLKRLLKERDCLTHSRRRHLKPTMALSQMWDVGAFALVSLRRRPRNHRQSDSQTPRAGWSQYRKMAWRPCASIGLSRRLRATISTLRWKTRIEVNNPAANFLVSDRLRATPSSVARRPSRRRGCCAFQRCIPQRACYQIMLCRLPRRTGSTSRSSQ